MSSFIISIDIGTTSTKSTIFNLSGQAIHSFYRNYEMTKKADGTAVQDPEEIFQAVLTTLKEALDSSPEMRQELLAVTFSSAMHSLIGLDQKDQLVTPLITWADSRANQQAEWLKSHPIGLAFYKKTGTPLHPMSPLSKIMWLKADLPELYQQITRFTSIKEYVFFRLFEQHLIDYSIASGTGLFNIHHSCWDQDILTFLELEESRLPQALPPTTQVRGMVAEYRDSLDFPEEVPFILGASDGVLANLGTNCLTSDKANLTIGTSGALRYTVAKPLLHPTGETFCYILDEGLWVIGGATNNGGMIIDWARQQLSNSPLSYEQFMKAVAESPVGANHLFFHPYLSGERAPIWSGRIRGSFTGLALSHTHNDLMRAVLEGICLNIADIFEGLNRLTAKPQQLLASGGFSHSSIWKQVMADVLGQELTFPKTHESSGLGAMILALKSLGIIQSYQESSALAVFNEHDVEEIITPDFHAADFYQEHFKTYRALSDLTKQQADILTKN